MANDPSWALQKAIYSALTEHVGVSAIVGDRVYDQVPAGQRSTADFPYVTLGADQIVPLANTCSDPSECHAQVDAWSRSAAGSKLEVKLLAGQIRDALDRELTVPGFQVRAWACASILYLREPDGLTERATLAFSYVLFPAF